MAGQNTVFGGIGAEIKYDINSAMYTVRNVQTSISRIVKNYGSDSAYELDTFSILKPEKLKQQCNRFKTAWEADNNNLTELSNVFARARTDMIIEGDTAETIFSVFDDYCSVIKCMKLSKAFDLADNDALYNRLGDEELKGSVIIHGIEYSKSQYESECRAHDNCLSAAAGTDDDDFANWLRREASRHRDLANNYYKEWMAFLGKKREYEAVNQFSASLYLTGTEYRKLAQEGMDILAEAFDGTGNYVVPDKIAGWYTSFETLNKTKLTEEVISDQASKWKDENGNWAINKLGETLSVGDPRKLTELDYLALCYAVDNLDDEQLADVIELSYNESSQIYKLDGTVTVLVGYQIGDSFKALSQYYGDYLENGHKEDINYRNYNILYTYAELNSSFGIETTFASYDQNKENVNINVEIKPDEKTSGDEFYFHNYTTSINTTLRAVGPDYDKNFTITPNNSNIDNTVANYAFQSVACMVDGVGSLTADQAVDKVVTGLDTALCLSNPGVATAYSIIDTVNDYATAVENQGKIESLSQDMNVSLLLDDLNCSATVIMDETTDSVYFTHVEYNEQDINDAIKEYNATVGTDLQIPWDAKTMIEGVLISGDVSLKLERFVDYYQDNC